jgi:hypothetical protein
VVYLCDILCCRIGRHGIEEVKAHAWFSSLDWSKLRDMPAPHLPKGSKRMKEVMAELQTTDEGNPRFRQLIKAITANFDEFKENGGLGNSPVTAEQQKQHAATVNESTKNNALAPGGSAASVNLAVNSPILRKDKDDAFLGYTYKRKPDVVRTALSSSLFQQPPGGQSGGRPAPLSHLSPTPEGVSMMALSPGRNLSGTPFSFQNVPPVPPSAGKTSTNLLGICATNTCK